jgi:type VI secretion system protein ImpH
MQALVTLLAPDTTVRSARTACGRWRSVTLGFYGDDDFLLDGNTPLGDEAMDANSQLLIALSRITNRKRRAGNRMVCCIRIFW